MKYRVKFKCYWYNTGLSDNHYYIRKEDFDTLDEAIEFKSKVDEQYEMSKRVIVYSWQKVEDLTEYERKYKNPISKDEYDKWINSDRFIEIENGFIDSEAEIVKYFPSREEKLNLKNV